MFQHFFSSLNTCFILFRKVRVMMVRFAVYLTTLTPLKNGPLSLFDFIGAGIWGSKDGAVVKALASKRSLLPGFDCQIWRHMCVEFVVGSHPCSEGFPLGSPVFLPPQKPTLQIPIRPENSVRRATLWMCHCQIPLFLVLVFCVFFSLLFLLLLLLLLLLF